MAQPYTPPQLNKSAFHCPYPACGAFAAQISYNIITNAGQSLTGWRVSICSHCNGPAYWRGAELIYPHSLPAVPPNPDLPKDIIADYEEAREILTKSPRGAAALFRLCVQKLCKHLGTPGDNINADIAALVSAGLNPKIQKSLDVVRVVGNNAVHPGQIDLSDKPETAAQLATLINIIADTMITQPKAVDALYSQLPESNREQIEKRDGKKS